MSTWEDRPTDCAKPPQTIKKTDGTLGVES
jgi:hypothetical protein